MARKIFESKCLTTYGHVLGSMALWGHYADGLRGYCVEYDIKELFKVLESHNPDRRIGSSDVTYSDALRPILSLKTYIDGYISGDKNESNMEIQNAFATKHESTWHYEQESRFFTKEKGKHKIDSNCIRAVYFGKKMPECKKHRIKAFLDAKGLKTYLNEVSIDTSERNYQLRISTYSG